MAETADLILFNGHIITLDAESSTAEAVAVRDGRVIAVGDTENIRRRADADARSINLRGHTLIPGMSDSHIHVSGIGVATFADAHIGDARSISEILEIIAAAVREKPPGEWVTVSGDLRHTRIREGRYPTIVELDSIAPNNPVLVPTGHLSTANSMALERAGITRDTPDPAGGLIRRDASGDLTGVLEARAAALVSRLIPAREIPTEEAIMAAQRRLAAWGVTSVREPGMTLDTLNVYRRLAAEERLLVRTSALLRQRGWDDAALAEIESWASELVDGGDVVRFRGIKLGVDGGLILTNAGLMREPYLDKPEYHGVQTTSTEDLYRLISTANRVGIPVAVHATGDRGLEIALETFARVSEAHDIRGRRFAIEHADLPTPHSLELMRDLEVVASIQPSMLTTAPAALLDQLGGERMATFLPYRTFQRYGIHMAGGSDSPAFEINPYHGIWSVVDRTVRTAGVEVSPEEGLTREEALRIYVQGGAYLTHEENLKGSIQPGRYADFVVLTEDIMAVDVERIPELRPVLTIMGGRITYDSGVLD